MEKPAVETFIFQDCLARLAAILTPGQPTLIWPRSIYWATP